MRNTPDVTLLMKILTENSRQMMLDILMDGRFHTVSELAKAAKIETHTASYHLKLMLDLNLVTVEKHGRFKYYQLKNDEIAYLLEVFSNYSPSKPINYLSQKIKQEKLYYARTCYDHLAGNIAVQIYFFLTQNNFIQKSTENSFLTTEGEQYLIDILEIENIDVLKGMKRQFCRSCLDWSERKHHLAGSIGKLMLDYFIKKKYVMKEDNSRAILISETGKEFLKKNFQVEFNN